MYSKTVLEHFADPRHVGTIPNADGFGKADGGLRCPEDLAYFWIRVGSDGTISEIKHKTIGCPVAIAASSMTCSLAQGMTLEEALQITEATVVEALEGVPQQKEDSIVGPKALQVAIADFKAR